MRAELADKKQRNMLRKFPLASFFILSYLFFLAAILLIGAIVSMASVSAIAMGMLIALASWTPNFSALVVIGITEGRVGVRQLFAGWTRWRVNAWWYLFGLSPIVIAFLIAWVYLLAGTAVTPKISIELSFSPFFLMLFFHTIQGATGEELGWRGFALPRLQSRFSPLVSALILGLIIAGWHGILHVVSPAGIPEWQFLILMVSYSVIITWAYNKSRGSLLIVTLFHFAFNFSLDLVCSGLALIPLEKLFALRTAVYTLCAIALIIITGKNLSKERKS